MTLQFNYQKEYIAEANTTLEEVNDALIYKVMRELPWSSEAHSTLMDVVLKLADIRGKMIHLQRNL